MADPEFLVSMYFSSEDTFEKEYQDKLSVWICESPENTARFARAAFLHRAIHNHMMGDFSSGKISFDNGNEDILDETLWTALAEYEKTAPEIDVPKEETKEMLIPKVVYLPREKRKLSKFNLFTFATCAAAILFIVLFVKFAPERPYSTDVATLVDQVNVKWAKPDTVLKTGSRLWTNEGLLHLQKGIVKLQYDNGVDVLVEGPAVFEIERVGVFLEYGRLYSRVSQSGLGFTVQTPTAQFVDQGTEFGLQADVNGSAELHVITGKVQLFADSSRYGRVGQIVTENNAVRFDANSKQIRTITFARDAFVRQVNSKTGIIWRGQSSIDLSDLFCGGNGLGTGRPEESINPVTGEILTCIHEDREGNGQYISIPERPFIDGVFVPNGNKKPVVVSSQNHIFSECPPTNNIYYFDLHKGLDVDRLNFDGETGVDIPRGEMKSLSSLMLHANLGLTFDLNAVRAGYPLADIKQFNSWVGISTNADREGNLDVWVLVDGQLRYTQKQIHEKGRPYPIRIDLKPSDRFLTLVATDGEDKDVKVEAGRATDSDWCLFVQPELVLVDTATK